MSRARSRALALLGGALLLALHLDFWRVQRARLWWGWLPEELTWRLAWMVLAALYLFWFCAEVWTEED